MAHTYTQYEEKFREQAVEDGYGYTLKQILSVAPAAAGYTIDTLLGLDNLFGDKKNVNHRYDYFRGPFGFLLGIAPLLIGLVLGSLLEVILRAPEFLGYYIDKGISRLAARFIYSSPSPWSLPHFHEWMLGNTVLKFVAVIFYTLPFNQPLNPRMQGPFGFILGWGPAVANFIVNRVAAIVSSVIKYAVDHVCDGVRFVYSGVSASFKYLFGLGRKPQVAAAPEETSSQLHEDENFFPEAPKVEANNATPASKPAKRTRPKITSEVEEEGQALEKDEVLKNLFEKKIDIFQSLGISSTDATNPEVINKAFRKLSLKYHSDKQAGKTAEEVSFAAARWTEINNAKTVLDDDVKRHVYMTFYNNNRNSFFYTPPAAPRSPVASPVASSPVANDVTQSSDSVNKPTTFRRTKLS